MENPGFYQLETLRGVVSSIFLNTFQTLSFFLLLDAFDTVEQSLKTFGYDSFRFGQHEVMARIVSGITFVFMHDVEGSSINLFKVHNKQTKVNPMK